MSVKETLDAMVLLDEKDQISMLETKVRVLQIQIEHERAARGGCDACKQIAECR